MAYYGGDPLGLNWLPMLALYSNLGKKDSTYEQKCHIGSQLQKLDGNDRKVIDGISRKIDELIQRNNVTLSNKDMTNLKNSIVSELGNIASKIGNKPSGPVVCDANSLVFDEDVKSLLSDLVREKSEGFRRGKRDGENKIDNEMPLYYKPGLYKKPMRELEFLFITWSSELIIPVLDFTLEGDNNTVFHLYQERDIYTERKMTADKAWELVYRAVGKKSLTDNEVKTISGIINEKEDNLYVYNDLELLRVLSTLLLMFKKVRKANK